MLANHWSIHLDPVRPLHVPLAQRSRARLGQAVDRALVVLQELYPDPTSFKPERFISAEGKLVGTKFSDAGHHAYGFGRRICPGKHIADVRRLSLSLFLAPRALEGCAFADDKPLQRSLFIVFTRLLWSCSLRPALDPATGAEKPPSVDAFSEGFSSHPLPFECRIEPRGEWVREVVAQAVEEGEAGWEARKG